MDERAVRDHLARVLAWEDAHATFDRAVADLAPKLRGATVDGVPHSAWQLLEHVRIAQRDILAFAVDAGYDALSWPEDYWPADPTPPSEGAWDQAVESYRQGRRLLVELAEDPDMDLTDHIPHGTGQTYLRALLLAADHAAYHVGQLVMLRILLGAWPPGGTDD